MGRIRSLFQVEAGEAGLVGAVSLIFFLLQTTHALTANAADTLFFTRFGVEFLPVMYMILGLVATATLLAYALGLGAWPRRAFYPATLTLTAGVMIVLNRAVALDERWVYAAIWIVASLEILTTFTMMWNIASDGVDARSGKRLFPLFASAGILGGVAGNLATGPMASAIGVENVLLVVAVILLVVAVLASLNARRHSRVPTAGRPHALAQLRDGYRVARDTPLLRRLAVSMAMASLLFYAVAFPFSAAVAESFETENAIASYLGLFSALATTVTFLVSLFVAERLFRSIGIVASLLLVAFAYVAGFGLWLISFGLVTASLVRLTQWVTTQGIGGSARTAVFDVVRGDRRGSVMAFMFAVPLQLGITFAGLVLWVAESWLSRTQLFVIGFVASALYASMVWSMRSRYLRALVASLQAGAADVFIGADQSVSSTKVGAEAMEAVRAALASDRPGTRSAGLEVVGAVGASPLESEVEVCLADPDAGVRVTAAETVAALGGSLPADLDAVLSLPDDASSDLHGRAAVLMATAGSEAEATRIVADLLRSEQAIARLAGAEAAARTGDLSTVPGLAQIAATDPSPAVRRAAIEAIAQRGEPNQDAFVAGLSDPSGQVRRAAAEGWLPAGLPAEPLFGLIESAPLPTREAAVIALASSPDDDRDTAAGVLEPILAAAAADRDAGVALGALARDDGIESAAFLSDLYERRSWQRQRVVIRSLPVGVDESDLIIGGLESDDADLQAQALEALDTAAHGTFRHRLIEVAEGGHGDQDADGALAGAIRDEDEWIRALAVRCIVDRVSAHWSEVAGMTSDPSPIVRRTAAKLSAMMEEHMKESLDLVGPAERVIALRRVPLFSSLEPADLHRIAGSASERTYPRGTRLFSEGEPGTDMCVVLDGTLEVTRQTEAGVETFNTYGPGDHVGELAVLRHAHRTADVTAASDARVLVIEGSTVDSILVERPEVARTMLATLADRLAVLSQQAAPPGS